MDERSNIEAARDATRDTAWNAARLGWAAASLSLLLVASSGCMIPGTIPPPDDGAGRVSLCGPEGLIDDCEDGNNQGATVGDRGGYWYTYSDRLGTTIVPQAGDRGGIFFMTPGGAQGSKYAARMHGTTGEAGVVFGGMGLNLTDPKGLYDASRYKGIAFWAKRGRESYDRIRFKIPDVSTDEAGGVCTDCSNDFGVNLQLSEHWQHFAFSWRMLKQLPNWGAPRPRSIKPDKIFGLQWQVRQPDVSFDIWVDQVQFLGCK